MRRVIEALAVLLLGGFGLCYSVVAASTTEDIDFENLDLMVVEAAEMEETPEGGEPEVELDVLGATESITGEEIPEDETTFEVDPEGFVQLDYVDVDIRLVLRMFSKKFNINIVPSQMVQGTVNIRLSNVHWEKALQTILEMHKLVMQRDEDIIKVITAEEVGEEPVKTKIYTLGYTGAQDTIKIIGPLLTDRGHVQVDTATNKLIITDVPTQFEAVENVIAELDKQTPQILIEAVIIEKETDVGENIGIKWDFLKEYDVGFEDIAKMWTKSDFRTIDSIDKKSITQAYTSHPGTVDENQTKRPVVASYESSRTETRLGKDFSTPETTYRHLIRSATLSPSDFDLTISALLDNADVEIKSQPRLTTVDNRAAAIKVAKEWPIPQYTYNSDTGRFEITGFIFKDIGIILKVIPHINKDSYITLDVEPIVSKSDETLVFGGGGGSTAEIPIIEIRTATTRVIVRSGETLVIGGLISSDTTEISSKIPLLGSIPLLGGLFRHKSLATETRDLIIFITPTIISESMDGASYRPAPESTVGEADWDMIYSKKAE